MICFIDRDGVLIEDVGYIKDPRQVKLLPENIAGLKRLVDLGYQLIVVTNQSGIGRGWITHDEYLAVEDRVYEALIEQGLAPLATYVCAHKPSAACACRKPKPGMILQAIVDHKLDLQCSLLFGDKASDLKAGYDAGVEECFLVTPKNTIATYVRELYS